VRKPKPEECDCCGFGTRKLKFWEGRAADGSDDENTPWTLRSKWLCRFCETGLGFEVQRGRVNHGIPQAFNVLLEALEKMK
jgi:hypothetical protein